LLNTFAEWFFTGFTRVTSAPTDEGDRSEIYKVGTLPRHSLSRPLRPVEKFHFPSVQSLSPLLTESSHTPLPPTQPTPREASLPIRLREWLKLAGGITYEGPRPTAPANRRGSPSYDSPSCWGRLMRMNVAKTTKTRYLQGVARRFRRDSPVLLHETHFHRKHIISS